MIEVRDLVKTYGEFDALRGLSFSIGRGEVVGFLGPNGAGKSTTMKILTCFMAPTSGDATVAGHDIRRAPKAVRAHIGYLPENNPLQQEMRVWDYISWIARMRGVPRTQRDAKVATALKRTGIGARSTQRISTLSKGYQQRVGLAQALVHDPDILILDEPTNGLDPNQIVEIRTLIRELGAERTVLLSSHHLPEVTATCSRMLIIHKGALVADGTPESLQADRAEHAPIQVVLRGASATDAALTLGALPGIETVRSEAAPDGALRMTLTTTAGADPRAAISARIAQTGWSLIELHRPGVALEELFRRLTEGQ